MDDETAGFELSGEGQDRLTAVDAYLEDSIRGGRPIEALIATRRLGEIASERAKQAARVATEGSWSWTDVGEALGITKQAAHEKLRERVRGEMEKGRSKLDRAEAQGRAKISRRAMRGRAELDKVPPASAKVEIARQRIDEWEQGQNDKLSRKVEKGRKEIERAERSAHEKLDGKS